MVGKNIESLHDVKDKEYDNSKLVAYTVLMKLQDPDDKTKSLCLIDYRYLYYRLQNSTILEDIPNEDYENLHISIGELKEYETSHNIRLE
jgi:hypothetical protein